MVPASENLHRVIAEAKLQHPGDADLDAHVAQAVALQTGRGWRLSKSERSAQIDAVIALTMAVERASARKPVPQLLGWL